MAARLHQEIVWGQNTDCVEFCPDGAHPNWLVLGSYELNEKTGERHGGLDLFRMHSDGSGATPRLALAASARGLPGVFDTRWQRLGAGGGWMLTAALADGSLRLFRPPALEDAEEGAAAPGAPAPSAAGQEGDAGGYAGSDAPENVAQKVLKLEEVDNCRAAPQMALCVDWARPGCGRTAVAAVSSSGGSITLLQAAEAGLRRLAEWHAHELEGWCVAFDRQRVSCAGEGGTGC
jgi:hypothetical protein